MVNEACSKAKDEYIKTKLSEDAGNPRKFWKHLKPLFSRKSKSTGEEIILDNQKDPKEVPNIFNEFFTTIGCKLRIKYPRSINLRIRLVDASIHPPTNNLRFRFRKLNDLELTELIKRIEIHKSSGVQRLNFPAEKSSN